MEIRYSFSLSRVLKHIGDNSFCMVSAYLGALSHTENKKRHKELKTLVRSKGYGYKEVKGFWKGQSGKLEEEYALFIPKVSFDDAKSFGKEFKQEAVIYGNPNEDGIILYDPINNSILKEFGDVKTNPNESWDMYSQIKNKSFKFSNVDWYMKEPPERSTFMGALANEAWGDITRACDISDEEDTRITLLKKSYYKINAGG